MSSKKITDVIGRMVFDSRGYPTVEAEVQVNNNFYGALMIDEWSPILTFDEDERNWFAYPKTTF